MSPSARIPIKIIIVFFNYICTYTYNFKKSKNPQKILKWFKSFKSTSKGEKVVKKVKKVRLPKLLGRDFGF